MAKRKSKKASWKLRWYVFRSVIKTGTIFLFTGDASGFILLEKPPKKSTKKSSIKES